jgi:hypothetical protein
MPREFGPTRPLIVGVLALAAWACSSQSPQPTQETPVASVPTVTILSPASGGRIRLGDEILIYSEASDPGGLGVAQVELRVNGVTVHTDANPDPSQPSFELIQRWTPSAGGEATVEVIAHRADGAASQPASLTFFVEAPSQEAEGGETQEPTAQSEPATVPRGRVRDTSNIRLGPGPGCTVLGVVGRGEEINLVGRNADSTWWQTDYLEGVGWVHGSLIAPLDDTSGVPVKPTPSCAGGG